MDETSRAATTTPAVDLGGDWFDPLDEAVRGQVRGFIERLLEEELEAVLGRGRSSAARPPRGAATGTASAPCAPPSGPCSWRCRGHGSRARPASGSGRARSCPPTGA
jgi:hypothetical protein